MTLGSGHALVGDERGWDLGEWGLFTYVGGGDMGIRRPDGRARSLDLRADLVGLAGWIDEAAGLLVLGSVPSDAVIVIDLSLDEVVQTVELERDPDAGLRRMRFFSLDAESLGCLCETTLFALGPAGELRWRWVHDDLTLSLVRVTGGVIELESDGPALSPAGDHPVLISVQTGQEVLAG